MKCFNQKMILLNRNEQEPMKRFVINALTEYFLFFSEINCRKVLIVSFVVNKRLFLLKITIVVFIIIIIIIIIIIDIRTLSRTDTFCACPRFKRPFVLGLKIFSGHNSIQGDLIAVDIEDFSQNPSSFIAAFC